MKSGPPFQKRAAALLSFLLPGLGQIYLQHYRRGVALFAAFSLVVCFPEVRAFLPLAAFLVAFEAYRLAGHPAPRWDLAELPAWLKKLVTKKSPEPRTRLWAYGLVAGLGFANWFLLFATVLYPMEWRMKMNDQVASLADRVRVYASIHNGNLPVSLGEIVEGTGLERDPWGGVMEVSQDPDGFVIRSRGKDGAFGTKDDLNYKFRLDPSLSHRSER